MANFEYEFLQDLNKDIEVRQLRTILFTDDKLAVKLTVSVTKGGEPFDLTGHEVQGNIILPNGAMVIVQNNEAEVNGNKASITLTQGCFSLPGRISGVLRAMDNAHTVLLAFSATVMKTTSDTIYDPSHEIPSVADLIAQIGRCERAADDAEAAAAAAQDIVIVDDDPPTEPLNKLWIRAGGEDIQIPTYAEFQTLETEVDGKQDALTFDNTPTANSNNPVKSGGVYTALSGKQNTLTFDNVPTSGSSNPVKSGGVYTALAGKQDELTFDTEPTDSSTNPVTSGGVKTVVDALDERVDAVDERVDSIAIDGSAGPDSLITVHDAADKMPVEAVVTMEPKQDLHGYTKPWAGGAGKNKLNITAETTTTRGVTFTVNRDSDGNVASIGIGGTATGGNAYFNGTSAISIDSGTYILTGVTDGSSNFFAQMYDVTESRNGTSQINSNGAEFVPSSDHEYRYNITVISGTTVNAVVYPMLRLASVTDATFEPYSNICPITGYDDVTVKRVGKNLLTLVDYAWQNNTGNKVVDHTAVSSDDLIKTNPGEKFTYYRNIALDANKSLVMRRYDANKNYLPGNGPGMVQSLTGYLTVEVPADTYYVAFTQYGAVGVSGMQVQVERGGSFTGYEEPSIQSVTVNVKTTNNNNTVYGGTLTINKDGSGTLVTDKATIVVTNLTSGLQYDVNGRLYIPMTAMNGIKGASSSAALANAISNQFECVTTNDTYNHVKTGFSVAPSGASYVYCPEFSSLDLWKTHLESNNLVITGELATPAPYTLTAEQITTIFGLNHIWSDADSISVEFSVDTMTKIAELNGEVHEELGNLESSVEAQKTSTGNPATVTDAHIAPAGVSVAIEPKQDLHGYEKPWVGGAGKNLLDMTAFLPGGSWSSDGKTYQIETITNRPTVTLFDTATTVILTYSSMTFAGTNSRVEIYNGETMTGSHTFTASGATVTLRNITGIRINYGSNGVFSIVEPMIRLATEADATYSPYSNICPISGYDSVMVTRTGKNLFDKAIGKNNGKARGEDGTESTSTVSGYTDAISGFTPNSTYTIQGTIAPSSGGTWRLYYLDKNKNWISRTDGLNGSLTSYTFTTPNNCYYIQIQYNVSNANWDSIQIESGSKATAYEPYLGQSIPISLSTVAGNTVYGGTLTINKDGTGTLVVDRAFANLPASGWSYDSANTRFCYPNILNCKIKTTRSVPFTCDKFNPITDGRAISQIKNGDAYIGNSRSDARADVYAHYSGATTIDGFISQVGDVNIAYQLETTATYTLTASQITTLLGTNHVWSDAGAVTLDYIGDKYPQENAILSHIPTDQPVAQRNHTAGSMINVDGNLYYAHNGVSTGNKIAEKATLTTVEEQLARAVRAMPEAYNKSFSVTIGNEDVSGTIWYSKISDYLCVINIMLSIVCTGTPSGDYELCTLDDLGANLHAQSAVHITVPPAQIEISGSQVTNLAMPMHFVVGWNKITASIDNGVTISGLLSADYYTQIIVPLAYTPS